MKQVCVTGAGGEIGVHLIKRLVQMRCAVHALIHNRLSKIPSSGDTNIQISVCDIEDVAQVYAAVAETDTIFHLAGRTHRVSETRTLDNLYHKVNVQGTRNVLEAAVTSGVRRFIFFSSVKTMGEHTMACLSEAADALPITQYGKSKLAAEKLVLEYGKRTGLHVACLRLPMVYGPGNTGSLLRMIDAIDRGIFPPWPPHVMNRRSMVHVSNVVNAAILAATKAQANGQCYIVADYEAYSTREVYERICECLGKRLPRWYVPLSLLKGSGYVGDILGRVRRRRFMFDSQVLKKLLDSAWYSADRISRELGYCSSITFSEALPEIIQWYRKTSCEP